MNKEIIQCLFCKKEILIFPYENKRKYCSRKCFYKERSLKDSKITLQCIICKKDFRAFPCYIKSGMKCCSRKCANKLIGIKNKGHIGFWKGKKFSEQHKKKLGRKGHPPYYWKGGKTMDEKGYIRIWDRDKQVYIKEHRLVMETSLKRKLEKWEIVHHINGIRNDNRIENLELLTQATHHSGHSIICPKCNYKIY